MATVTSTLKMFDAMTGPLKNITQSLNLTISAMQSMQNAANRNVKVDNSLIAAKQRIAQAESQIVKAIDQATAAQNRYNKSSQQSVDESNKLLSVVKDIAATYLTFSGLRTLGRATIVAAMEQQKMLDMFIARTGNAEIGTAMFEKFKRDALAAGQDVNKSLQSTLSFFSTTQNAEQLTKLNNLAQRLNAFDSAGNGIEGAAFALKEAMSGDIVSLAERFNMSKTDIRAFKIDELGKKGDMEGFIKQFDLLLEKQRMGQQAFEQMMKSPAKQLEIFTNNMRSKFAETGGEAMRALLPFITMLNQSFQAGRFDSFFSALGKALTVTMVLLTAITKGAMSFYDVVSTYWPEITAMLIFWGSTLIPGVVTKLWALVPPIYAQAVAWLAANWPILLIVAAIGLLIYALRSLGVTNEQIVGFVTGTFNTLFAAIYNGVGFVWNNILAFAEFLANIFIDPVYAIQKLFYDMLKNVSDYFGNWANSVVDVLNWLISKFNEITDSSIQMIAKQDSSWIEKFKPETNKAVVDLSKYQMQQKDLGAAFESGYSWGASALGNLSNALSMPDSLNIQSIGKVGEVGKIRDSVDISSEDLRLMREYAEQQSIQNFVSLTPTVQVTGDNHYSSGYDIDTVIARINRELEEGIASTARASWNV